MRSAPADARMARTIHGTIAGDGTPRPGSATSADWTVTRTAAGKYLIRFTPPFSAAPAVSALAAAPLLPSIFNVAPDSVEIWTYIPSGAVSDAAFSFVAQARARL